MHYEEFLPPPDLAARAHCTWVFHASPGEATTPQRIVPDGRCELVVHCGEAFVESTGDGVAHGQPRVLFAGQLSRPLWLRPLGRAHVLGVRFHAAGSRAFLGMPLPCATDRRLDLSALWPVEAAALEKQLSTAADDATRMSLTLEFVRQRIAIERDCGDELVTKCVAWLHERNGRATTEEMMAIVGLGRRQFERRFRDAVGLSPRVFSNVLRLRSVFDGLEANPAAGWTDAALAAGYFDHSHLIRDFRRFVGCTPAEFVATERGLSAAIVDVANVQSGRAACG